MALQNSMARTPEAVQEFLTEVHTQVRPLARWESYQFERSKVFCLMDFPGKRTILQQHYIRV